MYFRFFKGRPTEFILRYSGGALVGAGPGLTFIYMPHKTTIASVPTTSTDGGFVFEEVTADFQTVTLQGQFAYRIADPKAAASQLNFTIDPRRGHYASTDPDRVPQRITHLIQVTTRDCIRRRTLEETLRDAPAIAAEVRQAVAGSEVLTALGVDVQSVYFLSAKPTPEVARALEAELRESLLRRADEAIHHRRAAAVEDERTIKESELATDIALEEQRQRLIDLAGENAARDAEHTGRAREVAAEYESRASAKELAAYAGADPRVLAALALRDLGRDAQRLANLTITPDILGSLLGGATTGSEG